MVRIISHLLDVTLGVVVGIGTGAAAGLARTGAVLRKALRRRSVYGVRMSMAGSAQWMGQ